MNSETETVFYFCPHQDDELLSMGIDISYSVLQNKNVHIVLCTDGSKSSVRDKLNDGKNCTIHKELHNYNISEKEFIKARDVEFVLSCKMLGVSHENIHICNNRSVDGSLSIKQAQNIIKEYIFKYGNNDATVCTFSPYSKKVQHIDHYNLGKAVKNLIKDKFIHKVKFILEPYCVPKGLKKFFLVPFKLKKKKASSEITEKILKAFKEYSYWNPSEGRYAIGYHSVMKDFNNYKENMSVYYY